MSPQDLWTRYQKYLCTVPELGFSLDISRMDFAGEWLPDMEKAIQKAFKAMKMIEKGVKANVDEKRMVGHYWLRAPRLAKTPLIRKRIEKTVEQVRQFAKDIRDKAEITDVLSIGIGGSALGPMFVSDALDGENGTIRTHFLDNTDPDGVQRVLARLSGRLPRTLVLVISKSGGTPETHNGMKLTEAAFTDAGLRFADHAVAITMWGSKLYKTARSEKWKKIFPMFDWVGGRTSELSVVGLLPAALQGLDIDGLLEGARLMDARTRRPETLSNPAALLALMWYYATDGHGTKDMVVLPYKDRLLLFSRYLQQLIMESLGKRLDLSGKVVEQGLTVYGNKGSTDQHAYVQQLRDGIGNFFVTFIRVLEDGGSTLEIAENVRAGDYLDGFLLGTRKALHENGRESITITIPRVDAMRVGALIALFERAVGLYASLININAYHQPGVLAGKEAATAILNLQKAILSKLSRSPLTAREIARLIGKDDIESVYLVLEHLAANNRARVAIEGPPDSAAFTAF